MSPRTAWAFVALLAAAVAIEGCHKPAPPADATRALQPPQARERAGATGNQAVAPTTDARAGEAPKLAEPTTAAGAAKPAGGAAPAADAAAAGIAWEPTYAQAVDKAKAENKPVMMDLYADWCGSCRKLESETWGDPKVQELAKGFVCVKVNIDNDKATADKYEASAIPLVVFLKPDGAETDRNVGFIGAGDMRKLMNKALGK
jgi:thiol-disulfide isomerase/thioredoxin